MCAGVENRGGHADREPHMGSREVAHPVKDICSHRIVGFV
jgi:hypothetical protein